jgi:NADPH-dependent glutamate synthase beta subunit-like oxidoreductase
MTDDLLALANKITTPEQLAAFKAGLHDTLTQQSEPTPTPQENSEPRATENPEAFGLNPEATNTAAIAAAQERARVAARNRNLVELAKQELIERGEVKTVEELAGMPAADVLILAGFTRSEKDLELERQIAEANDPEAIRTREILDLHDRYWRLAPDVRRDEAVRLGLDPDALHQQKHAEMTKGDSKW